MLEEAAHSAQSTNVSFIVLSLTLSICRRICAVALNKQWQVECACVTEKFDECGCWLVGWCVLRSRLITLLC